MMMRIGIIFLIASLLGVSVGVSYVLIQDHKNGKEFRELEKEINKMEKDGKMSRKFYEDLQKLMNWQDKYNKKHYSIEEDFDYDGPVQ